MKKTSSFLAGTTALAIPILSLCASADTLGIYIGANTWQQEFEGTVLSGENSGINTIDIQDDLGYDDESASNFYIALEHPIPLIPNLRIAQTEVEAEENSTFNRSIEFDGTVYGISEPISSTSDLSHTDLTVYYELLDNWVSLDLGITARIFSEGFEIEGETSGKASLSIDETLPMLYVAIKFELPLSGLYVGANGNAISYDGDSIIDYSVNIGYESSFGLGVEAGLRSFEIEYEDSSDEEADITIDGGYIGVFYHF